MTNEDVQKHILAHRSKLVAFVTSKVQDADLAEDIVQEGLLKALRSAPDLRDDEKLLPWFYRILQNAIIDEYRKEGRLAKRQEAYALGQDMVLTEDDRSTVCECFKDLMPSLKPEYAEVLDALELKEEDPDSVAQRLGVTRGNLKVRMHRARQQLRSKLEQTCQMCATHGCLNCTCIR
ncbi:MAG TPA: RNA polymerase sigma factor [Candidatus Kapabacteria bacterium]|nr:RNA polymerase sigma factor [Candidatus Kapabacteria bacterium]